MIGTGAISQPAAARLVLRGCSPLTSTAGARGHLAGRRIITPTALRHFSSPNTIHTTSSPILPSTTGLSHLSRHASDPLWVILATKRSFHSARTLLQQQQQKQQKPTDSSAEGSAKDQTSKEESKEEPKKEGEEESADSKKEDGKKKEEAPPPPPHGDKTPWQVFTETLRSEFKASKEWNESTKALASSAHQFTESESVRKARSAYEAATSTASSTTSSALKKTGTVIGKGAAWTWDTTAVKGIRSGVAATGRGIEQATRPVRETKVYKTAVGNMKEVIDDGSSSRYGGWIEKEERRKRREQRELKEGSKKVERMEEDPNAGTNVTLHKDAAWKESWREFRDTSPMMQRLFSLKNTYEESENPLISTARSISDRVAGFFAENETAMVIKAFRQMDPNFQIEPFLREMREYILPEVLDAYVKGDVETLKLWLSDAQFHVYAALTKQYKTAGLKSDGRILDIRHVDISHARMLEPGDIPVFIITCRSQEIHVYRKEKTGELAAGMEDKVQLVTYAIGVTRIPDEVNNPETRGWRLIELQKSGRDYI
ncbi:mitochondrial import inner membrane translocase subunit [Trichophyton mentagrophytes]|nr:mitochondrial import inner membrane translocase subunit [Trichophyton mentagrophytes]